ncbi:MAG: peptidoglycan-binding protein [bacterium]|nr:peptidoglycan-binding protein [bacterium]
MKKHTARKALALAAVMCMALTLTSCYVPPDEITDTGYQTGVNGVPWDSVVEPTQIPTAVPITAIPETATPAPTIAPWTGSATQTAWQLPATQTPSRTATPVPTAGSLKLGATGTDVMALQRRLQELGYYSGKIDGDFGAETELAVKAFQRVNGLTVDGKVGVNTLSRINSSSALAATATPAPKASLKLGSTGAEVRTLQRRLQELGYYTGTIDGDFGSSTEKAVKAFQRMNGLTVDGKVGEQTWKVLNSSDAVRARSEAPQQTEKQQAAVRTTAASANAGNQHVGNELPVPAQTNTPKPGKATATPKPAKGMSAPTPLQASNPTEPKRPPQPRSPTSRGRPRQSSPATLCRSLTKTATPPSSPPSRRRSLSIQPRPRRLSRRRAPRRPHPRPS